MTKKLRIEADWFRHFARKHGKWQLATHLLVRMLADRGVDMSHIIEADKDEVTQLLLEYNRSRADG